MSFVPPRLLRWPILSALLVASILAGLWLRFEGIGRMPVWYDEGATFLHLSGKTQSQFGELYDGRRVRAGELLAEYQTPIGAPLDAVRAVADDEPQSGASYFAIAAAVSADAHDPGRVRALSAAASTVSLLLLGLLAWRLFDRETALAVVALAALSPLELRFAQEARPYALCVVFLLASALAAERASRRREPSAWCLYALCLSAALWTHPVALLAVPALLALATASPSKWQAGWLATAAAGIAWLPWALLCASAYPHIQRLTSWSSEAIGAAGLVRGWVGVVTSLFFRPRGEGGIFPNDFPEPAIAIASIALACLAAGTVAAALVAIARDREGSTRRYVLLLVLVPWLAFAVLDIALGGRRSTVPRYLIAGWAGIELAVAYWLVRAGSWQRSRHLLLALLLCLGGITAWRTQSARGWWDTDVPRIVFVQETAAAIDAMPDAVVVTDAAPLNVLEFARHLRPQTRLRLGPTAAASLTQEEWPHAVLLAPSQALLDAARKGAVDHGAKLEKWRSDDKGNDLWRVVAPVTPAT
jgi:uncharacterized membrane protein